ncbi:MAG: hypothetical protein WD274_04880 [Acidimicrobiia bacterium]
MRGRHLLLLFVIVAIVACDGGSAASTISTTSTSVAETTTTFLNPFLDVNEEESNFWPGDVVDIVGLPFDEQNWVGSFPADDVKFFGRLWEFDRLDAGLVSLGTAASYLGGAVWERVEVEGREPGYFPQEKTGAIGGTEDITVQVAGLEAASADEMLALVAGTIAEAVGLDPIQITRREFGGREVFYDLIGGDDPTTRGFRLRVVVEEIGDSFGVLLVERSIICVRIVADGGLCA